MSKIAFTHDIAKALFEGLLEAPESQISMEVRARVAEVYERPLSLCEQYDFLDDISRLPETEVSRFVRALCTLEPFYVRESS